MTKTMENYEPHDNEAKVTITAISRLLVKSGIPIDHVASTLIDAGVCLSYFHHQGDWKKFIATCLDDHIKTYQAVDKGRV